MTVVRLHTFWISHFSEKARWGLEFEGVPFEERALLPGLHVLTVRRLAPRTEVPVLVCGREVIQGSGAILDAIPRIFEKHRLQPWNARGKADDELEQRARRLECLADRCFGKAIQAYGYHHLLGDRKSVIDAWTYRAPRWWRGVYKLAFPSIEKALRAGYCRSPEHVEEARLRLVAALDETDTILRNQPYLLGDSLCRADIAVAALLSPLVRPREHPLPWPVFPKTLENFCQSLSERPTFRFVERMYRDHRGPSAAKT